MSYLFGDTDRAALRLKVLADVYAASSRAFLQEVVQTPPQLALDLGCGPGYTTHLLAEATQCARAIGLEYSEHFVALAARNATERVTFVCHDVTRVPFPTGPADLISCRLLLTHLQDPQTVIDRWATQLRPGGFLLLEEVEWIQTDQPLFRTYLGIVAAMLEQQHNQLYIGPLLESLPVSAELSRGLSRIYRLPVSTAQAATMFSLNIAAWQSQPFIQQRYGAQMIGQLEDDLYALAETSTSEGEIEWGMRQIAYERL
ncbi:MAG TPA: class I SAM-dependent methyltransferase [Ktedonobacterales bacterium]|nr:class I SAM-dependent methyltransferase [Ktedonobacterales bacterium]